MPRKHNQDLTRGDKILIVYQRLMLDGKWHRRSDFVRDLNSSPQIIDSVIRDIERHLGKDSQIERGLVNRQRCYRLASVTEKKALGFSCEEVRYLAVCRDLAATILPKDVSDRIGRTLTALALHLGDVAGDSLSKAPIHFHAKGFIDYSPHFKTIETLKAAIAARRICDIHYKPKGGRDSAHYRYAPGRIVAMSGALYLQGRKVEDGSVLPALPATFSIHRILSATPGDEYFNFNAADDVTCAFGLNWHDPKRIAIRIAPDAADYVKDRIWSADQTICEQDDGGIILTVATTSEKELKGWVLSFDGNAEIIGEAP